MGRAVCRRAVQSGLLCTSLSRRGDPPASAASHAWSRSPLMEWRAGDCMDAGRGDGEVERLIQRSQENGERVAFVHTVGSLLEKSHYKSVLDPVNGMVEGLSGLAGLAGLAGLGGSGRGGGGFGDGGFGRGESDATQSQSMGATEEYEIINRDTMVSVARTAQQFAAESGAEAVGEKVPFVFVSAFAAPPLVDPRYLSSKREAEEYLFSCSGLRPVVFRPGFIYSEERDWSMALAGLLSLSAKANRGPLAGVGGLIRSILPPLDSGTVDMQFAAHPPMRVEMLADAIVQSVRDNACFGIVEGTDIQNQAMWA